MHRGNNHREVSAKRQQKSAKAIVSRAVPGEGLNVKERQKSSTFVDEGDAE